MPYHIPRQSRKRRTPYRRDRPQGFSRKSTKSWYELCGVPQADKRNFYNHISVYIVWALGLCSAAAGLFFHGGIAALVSGLVVLSCAAFWVIRDRMFR